jgi:hypothetical protein
MFKNIYKLYIFKNNEKQSMNVYDNFNVAYADFQFFISNINKNVIIDIYKAIIYFRNQKKDNKFSKNLICDNMFCQIFISNTENEKNIKITFKLNDDTIYDIILVNKITKKNIYKIYYQDSQIISSIIEESSIIDESN